MDLKVIIDDEIYTLNVPDPLIAGATDFFDKMDKDMDQGWQMSRDWVAAPTSEQRLQIVGDRLLTALENENHELGRMMAAYILSRAPELDHLVLDTQGEIQNTEVHYRAADRGLSFSSAADVQTPMPDAETRAEAERQVSSVYKVGRLYAYSLLNPTNGEWETISVGKDQAEAESRRQQALVQRYEALSVRH
jgi:hypothetical protein